jgi:hypothetical protein
MLFYKSIQVTYYKSHVLYYKSHVLYYKFYCNIFLDMSIIIFNDQ